MPNKKKKSLTLPEIRLTKEGDMLLDSARIIANSNDPVKLVSERIRYNQLAEKMYKNHRRVK